MNLTSKQKFFSKGLQEKSQKKQIIKQVNHLKEANYANLENKMKQNLMFSLTSMFQQTRNQPSLIYPWMDQFQQLQQRIIGTNYIITGPSRSGKYSAVRYALGKFYPDVKQILVDCIFHATENKFILQLLSQFKDKSPKSKWPDDQREMKKLVTSENMDFRKLNPYIEKGKLKFIIIIKNGEHLVGFKKQTLLYNLFEWMNSQFIRKRGGLVILTKQLMLIDKFQKRVKSRFRGNSLCIFRPQKPEIYINIILKRIEAVIDDKKTWQRIQNIQSNQMVQQKQISDRSVSIRQKQRPKNKLRIQQNQKMDLSKFLNKYQQYQFVKQLNQYFGNLHNNLSMDMLEQLGISRYIISKIQQFQNSSNKNAMRIFTQQSRLLILQQIQCLNRLRGAIYSNKQLRLYLSRSLQQNQIIQIGSVLRIFQRIFLTLDETIIKYLSQKQISKLMIQLYIRYNEHQIPNNKVQITNILQSLNNIQILLLMLILRTIQRNDNVFMSKGQYTKIQSKRGIKLTLLYDQYKSILDKQIFNNTQTTNSRIPRHILQTAMLKLYHNQFILISPKNIWNSQINLLIEKSILKSSIAKLYHNQHIPDIILNQINQLGITLNNHSLMTIN